MVREKDDDTRIDYLLSQVGELKGTTSAMASALNNLNSDLSRANTDANTRYQQALTLLNEHSRDDTTNFAKVNRVIYMAIGALAVVEIMLKLFLK
jgi:hypothetical protein